MFQDIPGKFDACEPNLLFIQNSMLNMLYLQGMSMSGIWKRQSHWKHSPSVFTCLVLFEQLSYWSTSTESPAGR